MTSRVTILSTKTLRPGLVDKAAVYGVTILEKDFIKTEAVPFWYAADNPSCWVFTSANAVHSVIPSELLVQSKQIASISGETKKALNEHNVVVDFEAENAAALAEKLVQANILSVVFFCGNLHRNELPEILKESGIQVKKIIVYHTTLAPEPVTDDFEAVLFFSPSGVDSFLVLNKIPTTACCFCIGPTTARHLASKVSTQTYTAATPSQEALIDLVIDHYIYNIHDKE